MTTTPDPSNVPNKVSEDQLKDLLADAVKESKLEAQKKKGAYDGLTEHEVRALAEKTVDSLADICEHPILDKAIVSEILHRMLRWHTVSGMEEEGKSACYWLRDAGKFQAMLNILVSIKVSDNDFLIK